MSSGDKELLELLERSGAELYALLTRLTLREDVAEELMQDLFIKLRKAGGAARAANLNAYARRAAINLAFDWRRTRRRAGHRLGQIAEPVAGNTLPLSTLIQSEEMQEMLNAIGRLKKAAREVLVMRYIQQRSYDDIARQTGKTSHQVRAMCSRSIRHLRDVLGSNHSQSAAKEINNVQNK
ncbi:MAG: sigma-70 family RNA polymerase sigma factor [Phycisphaerales bacterium]|nr:MAG: sigma-70 family RNA polymerase sigma factor [Phycisphaerales bacterium]